MQEYSWNNGLWHMQNVQQHHLMYARYPDNVFWNMQDTLMVAHQQDASSRAVAPSTILHKICALLIYVGYIIKHNYIDHDYYITMIGYTSPTIKGCVLQIVNNISSQVTVLSLYCLWCSRYDRENRERDPKGTEELALGVKPFHKRRSWRLRARDGGGGTRDKTSNLVKLFAFRS